LAVSHGTEAPPITVKLLPFCDGDVWSARRNTRWWGSGTVPGGDVTSSKVRSALHSAGHKLHRSIPVECCPVVPAGWPHPKAFARVTQLTTAGSVAIGAEQRAIEAAPTAQSSAAFLPLTQLLRGHCIKTRAPPAAFSPHALAARRCATQPPALAPLLLRLAGQQPLMSTSTSLLLLLSSSVLLRQRQQPSVLALDGTRSQLC
jgi:hypothetical protein